MNGERLDDRVGQQRVGEVGDRPVVDTVVHIELEVFALSDGIDARDAQPTERAENGLPLWVQDLRLEDDVDDHAGHGNSRFLFGKALPTQGSSGKFSIRAMPIMPVGERVLCRSAAWGALARRAVPWALSQQSLDGEILEIGGGGGAMAAGMLTRFPQARLTIADLDPVMVNLTARRLASFGERANVQIGDATALPFADSSFDTVVSCLMLHHVGAWESAVAEVVRVLRPGGRFLGYDLPDSALSRAIHHADGIHNLRSITETTLRAALAEAGVVDVQCRRDRLGLTLRWIAGAPN